MVEPYRQHDEDVLAERLRQEAMAARPEFSERLHDRLCCAVRMCEVRQVSASRSRAARQFSPRWIVAAAAAVCLVAGAVFLWQSVSREPMIARPQPDQPPTVASDPSVAVEQVSQLASQAAENLDVLVDSAIAAQRWAQLDHDAKLAVRSLADRLPFDLPPTLALSETPDSVE